MSKFLVFFKACIVLGFCSQAAFADLSMIRTEVIPFRSQTLSDTEFLNASAANPVTIAGVLRLPKAAPEAKVPAVVILHGSGGYGAYVDAWVPRLNAQGIATFVIDSFSGRGLASVRDDQAGLGRLTGVLDAYRALDVLAANTQIDNKRIALMGFSRGGQGALYAAVTRFQSNYLKSGNTFAGYVALYPNCSFNYRADDQVGSQPIRVFHGMADDFNAFAPCRQYIDKLKAHGADANIVGYPGAYHVFDWEGLKTPQYAPKSQSVRNCRIVENGDGILIDASSGHAFDYSSSCVALGTTAAYDQAGSEAVIKAIPQFFADIFSRSKP